MSLESSSDALREKIKEVGVSKVAKAAGIRPTTLYSFCSDDPNNRTEHLRSDTRRKVLDALTEMGVHGEEEDLQKIVELYKHMPRARRRLLVDLAREMAEDTGTKPKGK